MRNVLVPLALAATAIAQGVTETIVPPGAAPAECVPNMSGQYELTVDAIEPGLARRQEPVTNTLLVTLKDGVLRDRYNRVGYIASNRQFQFDGPPQAGALITGGWTLCQNGFLALGPSQVFWRCLSGEFYNLYDQTLGSHCSRIHLVASQARQEVLTEVPAVGGAPASPIAPAPTTSAAIGPTSTMANGASSLSSVASELSTSAASVSSEASAASASPSATSAASGTGGGINNVLPPGISVAPPVDPAAQNSGNTIRISTAAASSLAVVIALVAMLTS